MCNQSALKKITDKVVSAARESLGDKLDRVILYGSYARGDYNANSDVDIMVLADIPREDAGKEYRKISALIGGIDLEYDVLLSVNVTDCSTFYKFAGDLPFYMNVLKDGVVLSA